MSTKSFRERFTAEIDRLAQEAQVTGMVNTVQHLLEFVQLKGDVSTQDIIEFAKQEQEIIEALKESIRLRGYTE